MNSTRLKIRTALVVFSFLSSVVESSGQKLPEVATDYIYKFITETATLYDNALVSDGTFLYDIRYDGGINGGGNIFKIKPDGSEYSVLFDFIDNNTVLNPVGTKFILEPTFSNPFNLNSTNLKLNTF